MGTEGNYFILKGLQLMTKENTTVNVKLFTFYISLHCTSDAFLSCQDAGHPHNCWFRWISVYYTHQKCEEPDKKAVAGTFYSLCFKFHVSKRCQVGGTEKLTHTLLPTKQQCCKLLTKVLSSHASTFLLISLYSLGNHLPELQFT